MSCKQKLNSFIFVVKLIKNITINYVFVGNIEKKYKDIIKKGGEFTRAEVDILSDIIPNKQNINALSGLNDPILIDDFIDYDDTIIYIKNKLFTYLSDPSKNYYIPEYNQLLVVNGRVIGQKYLQNDTREECVIPMPISSITVEMVKSINEKYEMINNNNYIIGDLINLFDSLEFVIDVYDLTDYRTITDVNTQKIYWPKYQMFEKSLATKLLGEYKKYTAAFERDNYIKELVRNQPIDNTLLKDCAINASLIHINYELNDDYINLLKIFNYLRKELSYDLPYIKYKEPNWDRPRVSFYKKIIQEHKIPIIDVIEWIFSIKKDNSTGIIRHITGIKGLSFKLKIYELNGIPKYATVNLYKNGRIDYISSYSSEYGATIHDIIEGINKLSVIINKINTVNYNIDASDSRKIATPSMKLVSNDIQLGANTRIAFINSFIKLNTIEGININDLYNFSKVFTPYVSYKLDIDEKHKTIFKVIYKRISNFRDISTIYRFINERLSEGQYEYDIILDIVEIFGKTRREANELFYDYRKRYSGYSAMTLLKQTGINISVNINTFGIIINGSPSFRELIDSNKFIMSLLTIYHNLAEYKKDPLFRRYILASNKNVDLYVDESNNSLEKIEDIDEFDDETNRNDIDSDYGIDIDDYISKISAIENTNKNKVDESNKIDTDIAKENGIEGSGLATDQEIDLNVLMRCDTPIREYDMCGDLCQDRSYFLRRLQRHDPKLFAYRDKSINGKDRKYSKACSETAGKQPSVMRVNPETHPLVDRDSYTYAVKYGSDGEHQNWYLCPIAWCPVHQIPISYNKITNIRYKTKLLEGTPCIIGKCPFGDHDVYIKNKINVKTHPSGFYPGFQTSKHPDGLCLPCCGKNPQNVSDSGFYSGFKQCLGEDIEYVKSEDNKLYILGSSYRLNEDRFGLLPIDIAKIMSCKCNTGPLKGACYLRKGIKQSDRHSFLYCMMDIYNTINNDTMNYEDFVKHLLDVLDESIFKQLQNGNLDIIFNKTNIIKKTVGTPYENFRYFLKSDELITEEYMWDFMMYPGVITDNGFNLVIFNTNNILCPVGFDPEKLYDKSKQFIIIIKQNRFFEPIHYVINDNKAIQSTCVFDISNNVIDNLYNIIINNCKNYDSVDWIALLKNNEIKYNIKYDTDLTEEMDFIDTNNKLISSGKHPNKILVDSYNKCVGLIVNDVNIPVKPSAISDKYPSIDKDKYNRQEYKKQKNELSAIAKLGITCNPKYKIVNGDKIVGIITETGRVVDVKPTNNMTDNLLMKTMPYYSDVDKYISSDEIIIDERIQEINRIDFEEETYERIRFEISNYLSKNKSVMDNIKNIICDKKPVDKKKTELLKIIANIMKKITTLNNPSFNIDNYKRPNIRTLCINSDDNQHCYRNKLYVKPINMINNKKNMQLYSEMIMNDILFNKIKREEIFTNSVNEVIDPNKIEQLKDEYIFYSHFDNVYTQLSSIYKLNSDTYVKKIPLYDITQPSYYSLDQEKYKKTTQTQHSFTLEPLNYHWIKYLSDKFKVYTPPNIESVYNVLLRGIISIDGHNKLTITDLKNSVCKFAPDKSIILQQISLGINSKCHLKNDDVQDNILRLYKGYKDLYKDIESFDALCNYIQSVDYMGSLVDIYIISQIYNINIIILNKKFSKEEDNIHIVASYGDNYMILYKSNINNNIIYNNIISKDKFVFNSIELPKEFKDLIKETMTQQSSS